MRAALAITIAVMLPSVSGAHPVRSKPAVSIEGLVAAPAPPSPRFILDAEGNVETLISLRSKLPSDAGCRRPIAASISRTLACETENNGVEFWRYGETKAALALELGGDETIATMSWSDDGAVAFVLIVKRDARPERTDILNSNDPASASQSRVAIFDVKEGRIVSRRDLQNSVLQISAISKDRFYYASFDFTRLPLKTEIRRVDVTAGTDEPVYSTRGTLQTSRVAVAPDEKHILFAIDRDNRRWDDFASLVLIDIPTGREVSVVSGDFAVNAGSWYGWAPDGRKVYFTARRGGADQIMSATLAGEVVALTDDHVSRRRVVANRAVNMLAYETESLAGEREIRSLSLETGRENTRVGIDSLALRFRLSEAKTVWWKTRDNRSIAGFLFLPAGYKAGQKYPVIVDVHGGGRGQRLVMAAPLTLSTAPGPGEWYAWAALGYVVFVPDYRSSGSYGPIAPRLSPCCNDGIVHEDAMDVLDGIDDLAAQGIIDPERVGLFGHSAGGARVIELLGGTRRFAAAVVNEAVAPDPLFNFINMSRGRVTGIDALERLSPDGVGKPAPEDLLRDTTFLASYRSGTPTLVMIGNEEKGATANLTGEVLFTLLKGMKVETRLVRFDEDGHVYLTPASTIRAFEEVRHWFDRQLRSGPLE